MAITRITKGVIKPNENYDTHNIVSTGIITSVGADINGDLDVDGHTNLDNVSISGVTTFSGSVNNLVLSELDVNGNADISGNLSVGGVLTYEDVTSIDSVGIITAQKDIHVGAGVSAVGVGTFGSLDIGGDIDVDGHTNLDNVSIAGVTTFTEDVIAQKKLSFADSPYIGSTIPPNSLRFGNNDDLILYHTGNYSGIDERGGGTGGLVLHCTNNFTVKGNASNKNRIIAKEGGSVELYHDNAKKIETYSGGVQITGNVYIPDGSNSGSYLGLGNAADFRIYHDGSLNVIDATAHNLEIRHGSEKMIVAVPDGTVELYHNNAKKIETTSSGISVTGNIVGTGKLIVADDIEVDDKSIYVGIGNDLRVFHNGTNTYIRSNGTGAPIKIDNHTGAANAVFNPGGSTELYHNNSKKLETTSSGVTFTEHAQLTDSKKLRLGTGIDFEFFHNGTTNFIRSSTSGSIKIDHGGTGETMGMFIPNDAVELYFNGSKKFETDSSGVAINGGITDAEYVNLYSTSPSISFIDTNHNLSLIHI